MRKNIRTILFALTMAVLTGMSGIASADISVQKTAFGMTLGDWSAAWWQYVLAIPAANNPAADTTGVNCGVDQSAGPVFYLTGNFTSAASVTRDCTVPAAKTLIIPIVNTECSTLEAPPFYGGNGKELRACASTIMDGAVVSSLVLTIDGKPVKDLGAYRAESPVFSIYLPPENVIGATPGTGFSVADGFWAIVPPLPSGTHVVKFGGTIKLTPEGSFTVDVTYNLTVQ